MSLRLEIVTPVHNRCEETLQCLRSLARSELPGVSVHIIIVDDGSTDGTSEHVGREFPDVQIIPGDGNLWYTAGTNRGIEAAMKREPDYVLAINNDTIFDADCIRYLIECAEANPRSIVGPLLLDREVPHKIFQVAPRWEFWRGGMRHWHKQTVWTVPDRAFQVELIVGNCVLYPAKAIKEAGLMNERRLVQYGDAEYTPRMRRMGWQLLIDTRARAFCKPNDVITGYRKLSLADKLRASLFTPAGPYSLKRRLYMNLGGAPNWVEAMLAIPVFYGLVLIGMNPEGRWALEQDEPPLSEIFADRTAKAVTASKSLKVSL